MSADSKPADSERQYKVLTCKNGCIEQAIMTKKEKENLNPADVDFHYDRTNGDMFVKTQEGKLIDYSRNIPFGPTYWDVLEEILLAASDFVELESENWKYAEIYRIRAAFGESPKNGKEHFFEVQTKPTYAIRWRPARIWRIITNEKGTSPRDVRK